ncbi:MAG TPA: 3'-5' exonuclease [Bacteroidales bacterium]|nr:3'-5' exonuclease [Bacteroidales bacterium]
MLDNINIENILFLDIETVPAARTYKEMETKFQKLWVHKAERIKQKEEDTPETLYNRAGIYAEFGKIVCISTGFFTSEQFRVKSFFGDDEKSLLFEFAQLLNRLNKPDQKLCAHNGKEFDFPYLCRRMIINNIKIPALLNLSGLRPWETPHIDTMELWKFGDYKNYTSLDLLSAVLNIPTPKDDINGTEVARVYWEEKNLSRIVKYCQKDVITLAQLILRFKNLPLLTDQQIIIVQ